MPPITTDDVDALILPRDVSDAIFERATEDSAVQRQAPEEPLGDSGRAIPIITGEPQASWVGEGERKPVSDAGITAKVMDPKKLAVIVVYSTEVARRNPANLSTRMQNKVGGAFGRSFDRAAITASMGPFTTGLDEGTATVTGALAADAGGLDGSVVELMRQLASIDVGEWDVDGWLAHPTFRVELLDARDTTGRPIYDPNGASGAIPALKGTALSYGKGVRLGDGRPVLIGGEWEQAAWGRVGQIEYATTEQATLEVEDGQGGTRLVHTFQDNLTAMRAEAWYGWVVGNPDAFGTLTMAAAPTPPVG